MLTRDDDRPRAAARPIDAGALEIADLDLAPDDIDAGPAPQVTLHVPPATSSSCPPDMLLIPAGTFTLGSPPGVGDDDEHPQRDVTLSAFCMDRTEVTVAAYAACATCAPAATTVEWPQLSSSSRELWDESGACNGSRADRLDHPVNCVTWLQADAYCRTMGKRLPTEPQWEYAARGTDGRTYPWGEDSPDATRANVCDRDCQRYIDRIGFVTDVIHRGSDGYGGTAPVGSYPAGASPFGVLDMTGNVFEWIADEYTTPYDGDPVTDPPPERTTADPDRRQYVNRGSAWLSDSIDKLRAAHRYSALVTAREPETGFRCVAEPR